MAKGILIAKNVSRRMSPTTGLDTDYIYEWRVQSEPGTQYPYSVHRIFTKNGEQQEDSVMSVGETKNEAIRDLYAHSVETVLNQAEKFGLFKSLFTREESKKKKDAEKKRLAEERQVREDAENSERFNRVFSSLRTLKGLKEGEIQIDQMTDYQKKDSGEGYERKHLKKAVKGYNVGNGVGVAIEGEGKYRGYTVTHLNTGLAMGSSFNKRDEAVALARAVSKIADWSKWQTEKDVPKGVMGTAASLVRAARSRLLDAKLEKALETGTAVKPKQEVKLVSPAADLQWSEPKAKLEKIADEFRKYYSKKVTIYGGGGAPPSTAILQRVELHPTILKGKDGYTLKAYVKGADSKILPADRFGKWDFWLGSWQIAVNPKSLRTKSKRIVMSALQAIGDSRSPRSAPVVKHNMSIGKWEVYNPDVHHYGEVLASFQSEKEADAFSALWLLEQGRTERSKSADESQSNALTIDPEDPRVERWMKDQGRMDVVGIDTPRKGKSKKINRKTRKGSGRRVGKLETQLRGLRG